MAISDEHKLRAYNGALTEVLGLRPIASLSEEREPRRVMDAVWAGGAVVTYGLERGDWNFATRAMELAPSASVEPQFGFRYAYPKPNDFARLTTISADPYFRPALSASQYSLESSYILTDYQKLYIKVVSKDDEYGFDSSKWSEGFFEYLKGRMAFLTAERLTQSTSKLRDAKALMDEALVNAKSNDAMEEGWKALPSGSWSRSRGSNRSRGE
jgi:hypothetical protein